MGIPGNTKADSSAKSFYLLHSISSVFPWAFELRRLVRVQGRIYFQLWSRQWSDYPESLRGLRVIIQRNAHYKSGKDIHLSL